MWILVFLQWAHSAPVLVKAPDADIYTYQVFVENSDNLRPSDIEVPCAERNDLESHYNSANDHFVNGSMEKAKESFSQIASLQWNCEWKNKEREMIFESFLRLRQISLSDSDQQKWIRAAVDFDPQLQPNTSLFPPPVIKSFNEAKQDLPLATLSLSKYYDTYTKLYRNGRPFRIGKKSIQLPAGRARFTFASDSHLPKTVVIDVQALQKQNISSASYIDGHCKNFRFQKPVTWNQEARLFFNPECIVDSTAPLLITESSAVLAPSNTIEQQLKADQDPRKPTWIERNYLWVGAALVGAVLISAEMNNRKQTQTVITPSNSVDVR